MRIGFFGTDERMRVCAERLQKDGHVTAFYGEHADADALLRFAELLILPIPASRDGIHLRGTELAFSTLSIPKSLPVFGGFIPPVWQERVAIYDCANEESFTWANASLTAEGGIATALSATGRGFYGMRIAVCGFGRIAKLLLQKLSGFGAPLTVYARSEAALAEAALYGYTAKKLAPSLCIEEEVVFNTVPAPIFDGVTAPNAVYCCDLGGGMPQALRQDEGASIPVTSARGVPGVFAPEAAGEIIYRSLAAFMARASFDPKERTL